jgi:adenine-specific DNA-methyltransferase
MTTINKHELANKIKTVDGLTNDEKSQLLELLHKQKKYGLVWEDKPEDIEDKLRNELPVLKEVKERAIISDDQDAPNHILIEGDNLEALTALSYTHKGKIDVIYIDPPYNTGNKDFVYNDNYVDKEDGYRHSKWLSFMKRRLDMAHGLLSDKGVIFISIDDNEQAQLKLLCDEVLGESNFVSNLIWQSTPGSNTGNDIKTVTEYVLMYSKDKYAILLNTRPIDDQEKYQNKDEFVKSRGPYIVNKLDRRMTGSHYSEALNYSILMPDGTKLFPGCTMKKQEHWNWRWSEQKVKWGIENQFIIFTKKNNKWTIYFKQYLKVDNNNEAIERSVPYQNLILEDAMNAARGTKEVMDIFSQKKFDYPKPLSLLHFIFSMATSQNSTILDFFAGSGTTLHATMKLNDDDGGRRQCILVTNNENHICEEVTYERNKRVIQGYTTPKGEEVAGLKNNNLRYYKTDFISRDHTPRNMRALVNASTDLLCIKNGIYAEALFAGKKLNAKIARYFDDGKTRMLVIYDERAITAISELIKTLPAEQKIKVYTFSPSRYAFDDEFAEVADRVELCALPAAIYDAYQHVLPKRRPKYLPEALTEMEPETKAEPQQAEMDFDDEEGGNA